MRKWLLFCQGQHQAGLIRMALGVIHMIATLQLSRVNCLVVTLNPFESIWNDLFVDTLIAFLRLSSLASSLGNLSTSFRKAPTLRFWVKFSDNQLNREVHHVSKHLKLVHICLLAILVMVDTGTFRVTLPASLLRLSQVDHQQGHHHPAHRHKCWDGEQHIFRSQLHRECSSSVNFGAESLLVMAIVLFTTARLNLHHVFLYLMLTVRNISCWCPFVNNWIMEFKSWCVRGKIGQVDVDEFKQVTQVTAVSSGRMSHYLGLLPAWLPGYA